MLKIGLKKISIGLFLGLLSFTLLNFSITDNVNEQIFFIVSSLFCFVFSANQIAKGLSDINHNL